LFGFIIDGLGGEQAVFGNYAAQLNVGKDNVDVSLISARYILADLVRLNIYTTDIDLFFITGRRSSLT
jgi:hypothetical protein